MRTGNPALGAETFRVAGRAATGEEAMTIQGTVNKTGLLLLLLLLTASWTWNMAATAGASAVTPYLWGGAIGGLVFALVTAFKPNWSPVTAPIYALLEGLFLGGLSSLLELRFEGIVLQAVGLTLGVLFALLLAYKSGLIRATENFKLGVVAATGGIFLVYMVTMVLGFLGISSMGFIHGSGLVGIGFSLFVVVIASMNLVLDFDFIESGAEQGAPRHMEWYGAFGLLVTLIWLYIEILRLLSKLRSR